jgi:hypothetical protein
MTHRLRHVRRRSQLGRDIGAATVVEERLELVHGKDVGHGHDTRREPGHVGELLAPPRARVEARQLTEAVARGVEGVRRVRAEETPAVRDDVVHDDHRLLRGVVDRGVVGARHANVDPWRELAVEVSLRQQVGARRSVQVSLHAVRAGPPRTVRPLDRHEESDLLGEGLRGVDLLDLDDAVVPVHVVERVPEPARVEDGVEGRRHAAHVIRRGLRRAVRG